MGGELSFFLVVLARSKGVSQQILTEDPILASGWTFGARNGGTGRLSRIETPNSERRNQTEKSILFSHC